MICKECGRDFVQTMESQVVCEYCVLKWGHEKVCKQCGGRKFETVMITIPWAWGPEIGVIKQPGYYTKCSKCGKPYNE